ncbi:MAG TPA: ATP-binding protein [Rubrobacter sp.]|nr:ATP-binding protein [Rubrobacter sp.]
MKYKGAIIQQPVPDEEFHQGQQGESALQNGEGHFHRLLEKLPAGAYTCDPEGLITYYNQHAVQVWGRAPKLNDPAYRFCGSFKLYATDGTPITHDRCWMALALKENEGYNEREIVVERPDGRRLTALAHANPIHDESGNLIGAVNVLVDITERKRTEEELRIVREAERSRIARDLHDGVLQDLAAVVQRLEATCIEQEAYSDGRAHSIDLHHEIDTLRHTALKLRQAVYYLRSEKAPSILRAVEALVEVNLQRAPECDVRLEVQDDFPHEVPGEAGREMLRIVQEALTNARRHSRARNVRVSLKAEGTDSLVAEVSDDGRGFDLTSVKGGLGLEGMRERTTLLGGDLTVYSEPGKGTSVRVRLPGLQVSHEDQAPVSEEREARGYASRTLAVLGSQDHGGRRI